MADKPKKTTKPKTEAKKEIVPDRPPAVQEIIGPDEPPDLGGPGGENEHIPTDLDRQAVRYMTACGRTQKEVAGALDISEKTLRKHYRDELDNGAGDVNKIVLGKLCKKILEEETAAILFFCKTRLGMKEQIDINARHSMAVDTSDVPDERVKALGIKMLTDGL